MIRKTLLVLFGLFVFLGVVTVVSALAANVYDNRQGDATPVQASADNVACVTDAADQIVTGGAQGVCVENLPSSTNNILWACDVHPTLGTGTTLRGGIVPGSERCISLVKGRETCDTVYVCAIGGTAATYIVHFLK